MPCEHFNQINGVCKNKESKYYLNHCGFLVAAECPLCGKIIKYDSDKED